MDRVMAALDRGSYVEAGDLADQLQSQGTLRTDELGGPVFALGAAMAYEADDMWSREKSRYYKRAARQLEEARDRGFPPGRQGEGLYLLGKSLYMTGRIPAARTALLEALKANPPHKTDIHRLLAGTYLEDVASEPEKALAENTLHLADTKLSGAARNDGLLQRARILLMLGRLPECTATLKKIPPEAKNCAEAAILCGRILMHEAATLARKPDAAAENERTVRKKHHEAIEVLRKAQGYDILPTKATRKAMYLIGTCFLELGEYRAALAQFVRIRRLNVDAPEVWAANFQEAELSRRLGRNVEALAAYRRTLGAITDPENFSNPWITLKRLRRRMLTAYQDYMDAGKFEIALQLTRLFHPLFSRVRTLELTTEVHEKWGHALIGSAAELPPGKAAEMRRLGRVQLRRAARVYLQLAKLQIATRKYSDRLWAGAGAYFEGHDYSNTIRVLKEYLKNESWRRHPQALVRLGEAELSLGMVDEALKAFDECVTYHPRDATAYRARLLASHAYLEKDDFRQAEKLLLENLDGKWLTPASKEWRDSLFALGKLLHVERRYKEAVRRLEEAVDRYGDCSEVLQARYLIADSCRQAASAERKKLKENQVETGRAAHSRRIHELLSKSLDQYRQVQQTLTRRLETRELTPLEQATLRNSYFAVGNILFDLGRYEEALKAYSIITNRYQNDPEVLDAYVRIADVYRRLNKPNEAQSALAQAKVILGLMKPETKFSQTTNYTRQQWSERLQRLMNL